MSPWLRVLGLFAAAVLAALVLKLLPPLVVLALLVGGVAYANHVLITKPKRQAARRAAEALGLRPVPDAEAGLVGLPFALLTRPGAVASQVMAGPWRGREIRVFDLELPRPEAFTGASRFTCALVPLPFAAPRLVVEPAAFLTPPEERPGLPVCDVPSERVATRFDVRCEDPAFAASFLGEPVADWLVGEQERLGLELAGSAALLYRSWVPAKERDLVLDAVSGFLAAVPAGRSSEGAG